MKNWRLFSLVNGFNETTRSCSESGGGKDPCIGHAFKVVHCDHCDKDLCNGHAFIEDTTEYHTDTDGSSNLSLTLALVIFTPMFFLLKTYL